MNNNFYNQQQPPHGQQGQQQQGQQQPPHQQIPFPYYQPIMQQHPYQQQPQQPSPQQPYGMPMMPYPMYFPLPGQHPQQHLPQQPPQLTHHQMIQPISTITSSGGSSSLHSPVGHTAPSSKQISPVEQQQEQIVISKPQINPDYPPEMLVWAKSGRQPYWPGQVVDPNAKECTKALPQLRPDAILVHFFGSYDYHYVNPHYVLPWEPNQTERNKKSRSTKFLKGCQEIATAFATKQYPPGWEADDMKSIQVSLDRIKQTRPEVAELAAEENRRISLGLITQHTNSFHPLKKPTVTDPRGRRRKELRLAIMRRLGLIAPLFE